MSTFFTAIVTVTTVVIQNGPKPQLMKKFFPHANKYARSVMDL